MPTTVTPSEGSDVSWNVLMLTPDTGALYVAVTWKTPATVSPEVKAAVDNVGTGPPTATSSLAGVDWAVTGRI